MNSIEIFTYHSDNAPADRAWVAYPVINGNSSVSCFRATEQEAIAAAQAIIDMDLKRAKAVPVTISLDQAPRVIQEAAAAKKVSTITSPSAVKYRGIYLQQKTQRWIANLVIEGKTKYISQHKTLKEAVIARNDAAVKQWGDAAELYTVPEE